ncbi:MAG: class I SAM-dependent methyltransferase [Chloroflexota bacterium]
MTPGDADGSAPDRSWPGFYAYVTGREPRPLLLRGLALLEEAGQRAGEAVEIGFGDGIETVELLRRGWRVHAIDPTPEAATLLRARLPPAAEGRLTIETARAQDVALAPFDLLWAGFAMPFMDRPSFVRFWAAVRGALRPGGGVIVNVFGIRDTWADRSEMTFVDVDDAHRLVDGLAVLALDEIEFDGESFAGRKHWHVFDIVARRPR